MSLLILSLIPSMHVDVYAFTNSELCVYAYPPLDMQILSLVRADAELGVCAGAQVHNAYTPLLCAVPLSAPTLAAENAPFATGNRAGKLQVHSLLACAYFLLVCALLPDGASCSPSLRMLPVDASHAHCPCFCPCLCHAPRLLVPRHFCGDPTRSLVRI